MSKKPQPQAKQNPKQKHQIVDQQNEPFIKSLQKRIRNINKKLTEIDDLQKKDNLKPEQVEKINRKDALLEERARLEQTITFYKQSYTENAEHYRTIQLKQLETLAKGLVISIVNPAFPDNAKLQNLTNALISVDGSTFNQAVSNMFNSLKDYANDRKLQKAIAQYVTQNGEKAIDIPVADTQVERIVHTDEVVVVVEEVINEKGQNLGEVEIIEKIHDGVIQNIEVHITPNPDFKGDNPLNQVQNTPTNSPALPTEPATITEQPAKTEAKEDKPHRERGNYRGKGNYRGGENRKEGNRRPYNEGQKKTYKPKYQQKNPSGPAQKDDDHSSSSSSLETRNFRREEIRQLEDQGFIVVGKPKPKARDQQKVYEHEHGKKFRHPHTAQPSKTTN